MMVLDMTKELVPILYGLDVALLVSAAVLVSRTAVSTWLRSLGRFERRRPLLPRPVLVR